MSAVWKFEVAVSEGVQTVEMPAGAQIIEVAMQLGLVRIWAIVEPDRALVSRFFRIIGTGWSFDAEGLSHRGTVHAGDYVWHLFEIERVDAMPEPADILVDASAAA